MPDNLQQAITAIKSGDKKNGRQLLMEVLKADSRNEDAWLWMTQVLDSDDERIKCLQTVLKINPDNEKARRGLAKLQQKQMQQLAQVDTPEVKTRLKPIKSSSRPQPSLSPSPQPLTQELKTGQSTTQLPKTVQQASKKSKKMHIPFIAILGILGVVVLMLCVVLLMLFTSVEFRLTDPTSVGITPPVVIATLQPDETPSEVRYPTPTPLQIFEVGEVVSFNDTTINVLGWTERTESSKGRVVTVELAIGNSHPSLPLRIFYTLMSVRDRQGNEYQADFSMAEIADNEPLLPGERVTGTVGFIVSPQAEGLQFVYDSFGEGDVVVNLGPNPVNVEPPKGSTGE